MARRIEQRQEERRKLGEKTGTEHKKADTEEIVSETDEEKKEEMEVKLSQTMGEIRVKNFAQAENKGECSKAGGRL